MSNRVSPAVASKRATKAVRARYKSLRLNKKVDPPAVLADRIVRILMPAAASDPAPASVAYRHYVESAFSDRFLDLCGKAPVIARRP